MITIPAIAAILGFLVWFLNSRKEKPDPVIGEAGKYAYILGLGIWLYFVAGKVLY